MSSATIKVWDIPGGVHPPENKHQSVISPIHKPLIPAELILPLSQHIGAPAEPIVAVGDKVLKGQMIAKATANISVHVHASTSGEVIAIEDRTVPHSSGMSAPCIIIKTDGKDEWIPHQGITDYKNIDLDELIAMIRNAGVAGLGGAGFPSAVKLKTKPGKFIETLILNGAECEPYITADDMLMRERADEVVQGTLILQHILKPTKETIIGVEDNKPEAISALRKAAEGTNIIIAVMPTKYPSGGKKQITQILTGKEVPAGKSSNDIGIFCQNVGTAAAIYRAVFHGEPLISRITTITGNALKTQQNYEVLLGTPISALLKDSGYEAKQASQLIMGGSMMGVALSSADIPVIKTTNCIIAPTKQELPDPDPTQACIRCGFCADACPVRLLPQQMYWFAQSKNYEALKDHHLFDCIECGACSYVCPSSIPLVQYYRASKSDIKKAEADQKKAEHAKERYEARLTRLENIEVEKEAKRKERQSKAAASTVSADTAPTIEKAVPAVVITETPSPSAATTSDPVQAAIERAKAKAAGNAVAIDPVADAQAKISALETRLQKAEEKLATAQTNNDSNLDAFVSSVEKLKEKLAEAKANVPAPAAKTKTEAEAEAAPAISDDPIQAAIERAKAKREGTENIDPKTKLANDIASLEKRIAATHEKIRTAEAEGSDTVDVLKTSVAKLEDKLDTAKQQLDQLG